MFDTMTLTKVVGAFCGALLIFLLGGWAAELIYHTGGGHGDDHKQAYVIETGDDEGGEAAEDAGPSFEELFVAADAGKGERVYNKCKACHQLEEGANGAGPYLYGVVGREVASADGFGYSGSLKAVVDVWTPQELSAFLENPAGYAPGTTMGFAGVKDMEDRANLIAYLDQSDGDTYEIEMPAAAEEAAAEPAAEEAATEEAATEEAATEEAATEEAATEEAAAEAPAAEEAAAAGGFADMVAAADPADGKKAWRQCQACHKLEDGKNGVGPHLANIVDRPIASVEGFRYSSALQDLSDKAWTVDELNAWLEDPKAYAPGNKMSYRGLRKEEDRAALIAYMQSATE
ncbi:cytochrome c family protein [uncultured Roseovarius sp.]|uniref:c-type cytochrome n=1 Tax=uncultured Roseovarius sp. TaxID=293344 RepID=UPI0025DD99E4|nr:cytochrome c family protein [uncultured Roseovarius sp.]